MTETASQKIGRLNALEAIDQAVTFGLEDSIENYWENLGDTFQEMNLRGDQREKARRAFEAVLIANNIAYRPQGL